MRSSTYFVVTKAFPVNFELTEHSAYDGEKTACSIQARNISETLTFTRKPLESFTFNDVSALQAQCEVFHPITQQPCGLVLQLLPVGTLVLHSIHSVPSIEGLSSSEYLRDFGTECYRADDHWSALVYEVLEGLEAQGVLSYCEVAPFDILQGRNRPKAQQRVDQATFEREMAWRAWASGNFATLTSDSDVPGTDWESRSECPERPPLPTRRGQVRTLWTNYFGWNLHRTSADHGHSDLAILAREFEPVAYMISRRSQCASGFHNVRQLAKLLVFKGYDGFNTHDMRVYLGSTRLALLAPKEYEESTAMTSRKIYRQACDDLEIDKHTDDFYDGINALVEDIKGVNAEREEQADKRLNRIAIFLTVILSMSFVTDIAEFLFGRTGDFPFQERLETLIVGSSVFLLLLILMWLAGRRR